MISYLDKIVEFCGEMPVSTEDQQKVSFVVSMVIQNGKKRWKES